MEEERHKWQIRLCKNYSGVPALAQWDRQHLCSAGTQVQFLAWHPGLRIRHVHSCGIGGDYSSDLNPGLETPHAAEWPKKKKIIQKDFIHNPTAFT